MSKRTRPWASAEQKRAWRAALRRYQNGICAGCGKPFGEKKRTHGSPLLPTLDHIITRSAQGSHRLDNFLLKHQLCNQLRRDQPATGCDLIWQMVVHAARVAEGRHFATGEITQHAASGAQGT